MKEVQVAIAPTGGPRCFYIFEDNPTQALRMLRAAFPDLGDLNLYSPLNAHAAEALNMQPGDVLEWHIGQRVNATWLVSPLTRP
jgi:hypothetical protein